MTKSSHTCFPASAPVRKSWRICSPQILICCIGKIVLLPGVLWFCWSGPLVRAGEPSAPAPRVEKAVAIKNISVDEFDRLRTNTALVVLDIRSASEYGLGHIPGAVNMEWEEKDFTEKVAALDKAHTYVIHCSNGFRSAKACEKIAKLKFKSIYNLEGGYKAWDAAGKPIEKAKPEKEKAAKHE